MEKRILNRMRWKNWSYTRKGAIIGFILSMILILLSIIINVVGCSIKEDSDFCYMDSFFMTLMLIPYSLISALIGAFIGIVYGRIKSKKIN